MKIYILLMFSCFLSESVFTQVVKDYFPLKVGDKWIYVGYDQYHGFGNGYYTRFEVTGTEIINDTTYYTANCELFSYMLNMKYFRKDSLGNVYTRNNGHDYLLFKMNAALGEIYNSSSNGKLQRTEDWVPYLVSGFDFPSGKMKDFILMRDLIIRGNTYVFSANNGCAIGINSTEDATWYLKRIINNGVIATPQVTKLISVTFDLAKWKIFLNTLAVMDTTTQIIIESEKQGRFKGSLTRSGYESDYGIYYEPRYIIKSNLNLSVGNDKVTITIPATVSDILGDKVDGNENQIWEGSPTDDYIATITIPSLPNKVDIIEESPQYKLFQNYPNPFNPSTKIQYSILTEGYVTLKVFDILGREIKTLVSEQRKPGNYEVNFDASSAASGLPSGVYFYKLQANNFIESKKMIFTK
jgi:hypothetical protein